MKKECFYDFSMDYQKKYLYFLHLAPAVFVFCEDGYG